MCFTVVSIRAMLKIPFRTQKRCFGDYLWLVDEICSLLLPQSLKPSFVFLLLFLKQVKLCNLTRSPHSFISLALKRH